MQTSKQADAAPTGHNSQPMRSALGTGALILALIGIGAGSSAFRRQDSDADEASCQRNIKQYTIGLLMYCQDYDERFPPMKFPAQVEERVYPYVKQKSVFACPVTDTHYLPNPALNYLTLDKVKSPATMLVLRDAKAHTKSEGKSSWSATYVEGTAKLLATEPALGKSAPTPPPLTHAELIRGELQMLRQQRQAIDTRIRQLEKEERKLHKKR